MTNNDMSPGDKPPDVNLLVKGIINGCLVSLVILLGIIVFVILGKLLWRVLIW